MYIIHDVNISNPDVIQVSYSEQKDMHLGTNQTNVPLAAFVTCYARLKLYKYLSILERRVLYFDTDLVVFISDPEFSKSLDHPQLGDYLGEFTDELSGKFIHTFISHGPKNYAKYLSDGTSECCVKGISLNYIASQVCNADSMKALLLNEIKYEERQLAVSQLKFTRDKKNWEILSYELEKSHGLVYDKRKLLADFTTLPYGYKNE